VPASFYVTVAPGAYFAKAGDTVSLALRTLAYGSNAPRARSR